MRLRQRARARRVRGQVPSRRMDSSDRRHRRMPPPRKKRRPQRRPRRPRLARHRRQRVLRQRRRRAPHLLHGRVRPPARAPHLLLHHRRRHRRRLGLHHRRLVLPQCKESPLVPAMLASSLPMDPLALALVEVTLDGRLLMAPPLGVSDRPAMPSRVHRLRAHPLRRRRRIDHPSPVRFGRRARRALQRIGQEHPPLYARQWVSARRRGQRRCKAVAPADHQHLHDRRIVPPLRLLRRRHRHRRRAICRRRHWLH